MNWERVRLVALDVDGVLTDGRLYVSANGVELVTFDVKDGLAIARAVRAGLHVAFITGRESAAVARRAAELGVQHCWQAVADKRAALTKLAAELCVAREEIVFLGDDVNDLPAFAAAGLRVAVADAVEEVRARADYVTSAPGGRGAAREVIELIMKAQGCWTNEPAETRQ